MSSGSGCYGRNGHEDAAGDAALLARAVGRPVRVQWMRADEHGWDPKGPPTLIDLRAVLDGNGDVVAWESEFFIPEGAVGNVPLIAASLAGLPQETAYAPCNIIQNSAIPYAFPNIRTVCHRLAETPFRPSWIRTPGRMQNTYANEAFIDELAAAAGADPLDFRLKYLKDPRGIELLQRLAALSKWGNGRRRKRTLAPVMLALGFTLVYGILELINVAALQRVHDQLLCRHVGSRVSRDLGPEPGPDRIGAGRNPGIRLRRHNDRRRRARRRDRTLVAAAIARRPRHGGDDHDDRRLLYPVQHHPLTVGAGSENYPNPMPVVRWQLGEVTLELKELLIWGVAVALMVALHFFRQPHSAWQGDARDGARYRGGLDDGGRCRPGHRHRVLFGIGAGRSGGADLRALLQLHELHHRLHGRAAGVHGGRLGRHRQHSGSMVGGLLIGLLETLGGQLIAVRWTDVIIFSILVLVLVFVQTGLLGRSAPTKS